MLQWITYYSSSLVYANEKVQACIEDIRQWTAVDIHFLFSFNTFVCMYVCMFVLELFLDRKSNHFDFWYTRKSHNG